MNEKNELSDGFKFDTWKTRLIIFTSIVLLWVITWVVLIIFFSDYQTRGQFGDMFGVVNSLFSGLAFGGIIYTILLQREELKAQREELRLTKKEFIIQNETLRLQRFENTFFNLLEVHNKVVDSLKDSYHNSAASYVESKGRSVFDEYILKLKKIDSLKGDPNNFTKSDFNRLAVIYRETLGNQIPLAGLSYYFQSLASILSFIYNSDLLAVHEDEYKERKNRLLYFNIFLSTQSLTEKSLIFYHIAFGWTVSQFDDYLSRLRLVEKEYRIYEGDNTIYLPEDNNYHMGLLGKYFELFPHDL